MKSIAFVGSRKLADMPRSEAFHGDHIVFYNLAFNSAKNGYCLRSGGAEGADLIAEKAYALAMSKGFANEKQIEIFHPWKSFGSKNPLYNLYKIPKELGQEEILKEVLDPSHFQSLKKSRGAFALHKRNVNQILGENLDSSVSCVICWTKSGKPEGGTATAIKLALNFNIPVYNTQGYNKEKYDELVKRIKTGDF